MPRIVFPCRANEPRVAGRAFRADRDRGRLFCRTLLPADAMLDTIGDLNQGDTP